MIMARDMVSLLRGENMEKLPMGPTSSRPGPTLLSVVMTAVNVVPKEKLSRDKIKVANSMIMKYTVK